MILFHINYIINVIGDEIYLSIQNMTHLSHIVDNEQG